MDSRFAFVNYVGKPDEAKKSLQRVRKHVMHDYLKRQKKLQTVQSLTPRRIHPRRVRKASQQSPGLTHAGSTTSQSSVSEIDTPSSWAESNPEIHDCTASNMAVQPYQPLDSNMWFLLRDPGPSSLDAHLFDPFNSLPVPSGKWADNMYYWHFYQPFDPSNSWASNSWERDMTGLKDRDLSIKQELWSAATENTACTALFHTLLCTSAAKYKAVTRRIDSNVGYFEHKAEAFKAIDAGLRDDAVNMTDNFIMLVSIQANLTLADGELRASKVQLSAVSELAAKRGGLAALEPLHQSHIKWNSIKVAAVTLKKPMIACCSTEMLYALPLEATASTATMRTSTILDLLTVKSDWSEVATIFHRMFSIDLSLPTCPQDPILAAMENTMYQTAYQLCQIVPGVRSRVSHNDFRATDALVLCAASSFWIALPGWVSLKILFPNIMNTILFRLLMITHDGLLGMNCGDTNQLIEAWKREAKLEALLWVLFMSAVISQTMDATILKGEWITEGLNPAIYLRNLSYWLIPRIQLVLGELQIHDVEHFKSVLRTFPSNEVFLTTEADRLWPKLQPRWFECL